MEQYHGTTILSVRRGKRVAMGGDGQVTLGNIVIKAGARKVRRIHKGDIRFLYTSYAPDPRSTVYTLGRTVI